jgi:hypothetical protein
LRFEIGRRSVQNPAVIEEKVRWAVLPVVF